VTNKRASYIIAALILLITAACQPQVELEPPPQAVETIIQSLPLATPPPTTPPLATPPPTTPPLATSPIAATPLAATPLATLPAKELLMTVEPTNTPPAPAEEESIEPTPNEQAPELYLQPAILKWVDEAKEDLALRQSISSDQIELHSWELKEWPNAGLGCPQPGMAYAQVMVEGYLIRLRVDDEIYNYHGGGNRSPFLCEQLGPKIVITKQAPLNIKQTPTKSIPPPRD